jgi:hypothetical protein
MKCSYKVPPRNKWPLHGQHGDGLGGVNKKDKCESSLRAAFPIRDRADHNISMKQAMILLVLPLLYLSASGYVSVMSLMSGGQVADSGAGNRGPVTALAMLQTVSSSILPKKAAAASESDGELAEKEKLRQSYFASFIEDLSTSDDGLLKSAAVMLARKQKNGDCNVQEAKQADPWNRQDGIRRDIGLCMQIKNDAAIIDEYIAFHWVQGVSKFIIYDDGSEDDPWSVLEKYAALDIAEYHDMMGHPHGGSFKLQLDNVNKCFTSMRERASHDGMRWIMFPDVDEFFLSSVPGETLSDTLNAKYKGEACLQIARTWYGSSFRHQKPTGLVTETYLLASPDYGDGYPKLIANIHPDNRTRNATQLYSVHDFQDQDEIPCKFKNDIRDIRINHYLRSLKEYDQKALHRDTKHERNTEPLKKFFDRDRNTVLSPVAADYSCRVHALLQQIQEMQVAGKIRSVQRPRPWNETNT